MRYPIGKMAKAFGLTKEALRYYERAGVLIPSRDENGYRYYEKSQIQNMAVIRRMQNIGFSLKEIADLMTSYSEKRLFEKLEESIRKKEKELEYQMALLERLKADTAFFQNGENYDRPFLVELPMRYVFYFDSVEMLVNDRGIRDDIIRWYDRMYPALGLETMRWEDISLDTPRRIGLIITVDDAKASGFPVTKNIETLSPCRAVQLVTTFHQESSFFLDMAPVFEAFAREKGLRYQKEFHLLPNFSYAEPEGRFRHIIRIQAPLEE